MTLPEAIFPLPTGYRFQYTPIPSQAVIPHHHHHHSTTYCRSRHLLAIPLRQSDSSTPTTPRSLPRARHGLAPQTQVILQTTASRTPMGPGAVPTQVARRTPSSHGAAISANTTTGTASISSVATKVVRRRPKVASPARRTEHGTKQSTTPVFSANGKVVAAFLVGSTT